MEQDSMKCTCITDLATLTEQILPRRGAKLNSSKVKALC